jgi:hypothetical protein
MLSIDSTGERSACPLRFPARQGADRGAGEGRGAGAPVPGVLGAFSLAVGWVLAAPVCGAALPSAGAAGGAYIDFDVCDRPNQNYGFPLTLTC